MTRAEITRFRRELRSDPKSLRFVALADALRRVGQLAEAEQVALAGLRHHPGHKTGQLVHARILAATARSAQALELLDALYPRDSGNVALVELYLELLVAQSRDDDAWLMLDRAELIGLPRETLDGFRELLEDDGEDADGFSGDPFAGMVSMHGQDLMAVHDPYAIPVVAERLERVGRLRSALALWEEISWRLPDTPGVDMRVADLRLRVGGPAQIHRPMAPRRGPASDAALTAIKDWASRIDDALTPASFSD